MYRIFIIELTLSILLVVTGCNNPSPDRLTFQNNDANNDTLIDSSLVGWWKFDEGNGTTASDSSGYGNTAIIKNGGWADGKIGNALQMDGNNDGIVTIALSDSLRSTAEKVTVMGWAFRTAEHNVDVVGHSYPPLFFGFHGPLFKWQLVNVKGKKARCYADRRYHAALNQWFHLAGTYDGRTARLYVDGNEICSTWLWHSGSIKMPEVPFTISGYFSDTGEIVDEITGKIDDVRIYNRVLSVDEIRHIYNAGKG